VFWRGSKERARLLAELEARDRTIAEQGRRIAELEAEVRELRKLVAELQERLKKNSSNSSRPPSSDRPESAPPRRKAKGSGGKPGGQRGHEGHQRQRLPADETRNHYPEACSQCGCELPRRSDAEPRIHQVVEVPEPRPRVTDHRCHGVECPECAAVTYAELPLGVPISGFGPRLSAMAALLSGRFKQSKRDVQELLADLFGVNVSLGGVSNMEKRVSDALADAHEEARRYVVAQKTAYGDETSWSEGNGKAKKAWLWVAATELVTFFKIASSRAGEVAKEMLEGFVGVLVTDRYTVYRFFETLLRQLCWAHLLRDFEAIAERGGKSGRIGRQLLREGKRMFKWWHRVRDGTLSRSAFEQRMKAVESRVGRLLREAQRCGNLRTSRTATEILKLEAALWTFVHVPGVEPTNNRSERSLRRGVMWRRVSFGTQSARGSRFVERILTATTTLRQQGRNVLTYLTEAVQAASEGRTYPSLLPNP
jgi:transposase